MLLAMTLGVVVGLVSRYLVLGRASTVIAATGAAVIVLALHRGRFDALSVTGIALVYALALVVRQAPRR